MRAHSPYYQMHRTLLDRFPHLRPAYTHGLARWVYGTLLAHSACQSAVLAALAPLGKRETLRQRLRDTFRASADKRVPCQCDWDSAGCFVPLLRWLLSWWRGTDLAFALDALPSPSTPPVMTTGSSCWRSASSIAAPPCPSPGTSCPPIRREHGHPTGCG